MDHWKFKKNLWELSNIFGQFSGDFKKESVDIFREMEKLMNFCSNLRKNTPRISEIISENIYRGFAEAILVLFGGSHRRLSGRISRKKKNGGSPSGILKKTLKEFLNKPRINFPKNHRRFFKVTLKNPWRNIY